MPGVFRCRICGEVYFGKHPSHCPHCGAHERYMIKLSVWKNENVPLELSDLSRKNLEETRELELSATQFYRAAAKETSSEEIRGFFKYLARTEKEHYEVACKLLGAEISPAIDDPSEAFGSDMANLEESKKREEHAASLYAGFAEVSAEPRVKEVFSAISEVEADHIELDTQEINTVSG